VAARRRLDLLLGLGNKAREGSTGLGAAGDGGTAGEGEGRVGGSKKGRPLLAIRSRQLPAARRGAEFLVACCLLSLMLAGLAV
jgi:hypothetical protein